MTQRRHLTLVSAGATLLASLPLATVFDRWTWFVDAVVVVAAVAGAGLLVRSLRVPQWAPTAAQAGAFLIILGWIFHSGHELLGVLPSPSTFRHWNDLLLAAGRDMRELGIPVDDREGLLFLSTLGVGGVAIVVDLFAVVLRRPALAGLPMLAIYSVPVAVHTDSVNFIPFAAGAAGFLWLLVTDNVDRVRRFGRRFTGDGRDVDLWEPSPLAAAGRRIALVGVLLAVVLPVAVPGMTGGLLDRFGTGGEGGGGGGGGSSVDLFANLSGALSREKPSDMVRVSTTDPDPAYIRFGVADEISDSGFRNHATRGGQPVTSGFPNPTIAGLDQRRYHAQVTILNFDMRLLPIYLVPTKMSQVDSSWEYDRDAGIIYSGRQTTRGKKYSFDYMHTDFTPEALRTVGPLSPNDPIQKKFTALPSQNAQVDAIVKQQVKDARTPYDKVIAIFNFFSRANRFTYSQQTKVGTSGSDIVDFLTNRQGFCEQYSAAMAWLVRAAGIPARVAFGFTKGSAQKGSTYTLTNLNLHAWTEVYFERFGWVPFDPTPATAIAGSVSTPWAPNPNLPSTGQTGQNDDPRIGQNPGAGPSASAGPGPHENFPNGGAGQAGAVASSPAWAQVSKVLLTTLSVLAALVVLLLIPAIARLVLRRRRRPDRIRVPAGRAVTVVGGTDAPGPEVFDDSPAAQAVRLRAHAAWDELVDMMVDHRFPVDPAETPRAVVDRLTRTASLTGPAAEGAQLLGTAEERARYARQPLTAADVGPALARVRKAVQRRVSTRTRLVASLMPPSTTARMRVGAVNLYTGLSTRIADVRDGVLKLVNPRQLLAGRGAR